MTAKPEDPHSIYLKAFEETIAEMDENSPDYSEYCRSLAAEGLGLE